MIKRAFAAASALKKGSIIYMDGRKYIALPTRLNIEFSDRFSDVWIKKEHLGMLVPVRVTDDNTYAHLSGRVFATYALRSAIWDCMHPIYTTAMACALCTYGFDSIPLIFFGSTFYTGIAIINTHPITERYRQREAIYEALGRDKTGGGMPFLLRWR